VSTTAPRHRMPVTQAAAIWTLVFLIGLTGGELLRQQALDDPTLARDEQSHRADDGGHASAICRHNGTERHTYHHYYGATADDHDGRVSRQLLSGRPGQRGVTN
jgi:hypothetical protein